MKNSVRMQRRYAAMRKTLECCQNFPLLASAISQSNKFQTIIPAEQTLPEPEQSEALTRYVFAKHGALSSARACASRTLIMCAADPLIPGGDPFEGNRLEERICRCSTLLPLLQNASPIFYEKNVRGAKSGEFGFLGSDDMILTKGVRVFRELQENGEVETLPVERWYDVDVLSCIAPRFESGQYYPTFYKKLLQRRLKRALTIASFYGYKRIVMNRWGCEGERNDVGVVATVMRELLDGFGFEEVVIECEQVEGDAFYERFRAERVSLENRPQNSKMSLENRPRNSLLAGEVLDKIKRRARNGWAIVSFRTEDISELEKKIRQSGLCNKRVYGCFRRDGELRWERHYIVVAEDRNCNPREIGTLSDKGLEVRVSSGEKALEVEMDEFMESLRHADERYIGCFVDEPPYGWISRMGHFYSGEIF